MNFAAPGEQTPADPAEGAPYIDDERTVVETPSFLIPPEGKR